MDIFSLLHTDLEQVKRVGDVQKDQQQLKKRKIDRNFTNLLYGYSIYMVVVLQMHPQKAPTFIKYMDLIHRAFRERAGPACETYDDHFQLRPMTPPLIGKICSGNCGSRLSFRPGPLGEIRQTVDTLLPGMWLQVPKPLLPSLSVRLAGLAMNLILQGNAGKATAFLYKLASSVEASMQCQPVPSCLPFEGADFKGEVKREAIPSLPL